jgi:hypothetical protein
MQLWLSQLVSSLTRLLTSTTGRTCWPWWAVDWQIIVLFVLYFFICNLYALCFIYFVLLKCVMYLVVGYVSSACFSLYRMLEAIVGLGEGANRGVEKSVQLDRDLLATLFDRWCFETHTFHLPCGEMTLFLHSVSCVLSLPNVGVEVGVVNVKDTLLT